jgi:hypothetical protein
VLERTRNTVLSIAGRLDRKCGCPSGQYCAVSADGMSGQCAKPLEAGAPCYGNSFCQSNLCLGLYSDTPGSPPGDCSLPLGARCLPFVDPCNLCTSDHWCSQICSGTSDLEGTCPKGFACLVPGGGDAEAICFADCAEAGAGCPSPTVCLAFSSLDGGVGGYACQ